MLISFGDFPIFWLFYSELKIKLDQTFHCSCFSPSGGSLSLSRFLIPPLYRLPLTPSFLPTARLGFPPSPSQTLPLPCWLPPRFSLNPCLLSLSLSGIFPHFLLSSSFPISRLFHLHSFSTLCLPALVSGTLPLTTSLSQSSLCLRLPFHLKFFFSTASIPEISSLPPLLPSSLGHYK